MLGLAFILTFIFSNSAFAQLSGTLTIPGSYPTIAAAVTDLNAQGVGAGGVVFNVTAGHLETSDVPVITATGTVSNTILFQKNGAGNNPKIMPLTPGTVASSTTIGGHGDGIIIINGGDYITFDGIDVQTDATFTGNGMYEYGYYLKKASGTDACKFVTIQNCNITLNKAAIYSFGIFVSNISGTTSVVVTTTGGRTENINIDGNTISNAYGGVQLRGYLASSPYDLYDQVNRIGLNNSNTISNFGGGASTAYGIYAIYQNDLYIANNSITGGDNTTTTHYGIFISTAINSNIDIENNTISLTNNSTTSQVSGISIQAGATTGTTNTQNITGNTITNFSRPAATSGVTYFIHCTSNYPQNLNISGNTIGSSTLPGTGTIYGIYQLSNPVNVSITGNLVSDITRTGTTSTSAFYGIYCDNSSATTSSTISENVVHSLTGNGSTGVVGGITVGSQATLNVFKNKIYNIKSENAGGLVYGLTLGTGVTTYNVYNNLIGDLRAPLSTSTGTDAIRGINITSATTNSTINLSYNTVYLNATSSGANFTTTGIYHTTSTTATTAVLQMRNNIIVNNSVPTGTGLTIAYRRSSTSLTNYGSLSNYNLLYSGTPGANKVIFYDGATSDQTLAAYKTRVAPRDANSVTENPSFISTTGSSSDFLHINAATATQIESGAINVAGITEDYDGNIRQGNGGYGGTGSAPDIGADEFEGIPVDITLPIITYTLLSNTGCTNDRTLSATISDASGVNTTAGTKPRLYFKKSSDDNTYAGNTSSDNGWKFVEASNASSPFSFTTDYSLLQTPVAIGDVIQYFVVAQDLATTPNVAINSGVFSTTPSSVALIAANFPITGTINSYSMTAGLSGTVTIGMTGDYPSFSAASTGLFHAINTTGLSGNLTVLISDVSIAETGAVALNSINVTSCSPGPYSITIQPDAGIAAVLSGTSTTPLIDLNGADNVTINGLNSGGSSLTLRNLGTTAATIRLIGDASNNTITNTTLEGAVTTTSLGVVMLSTGVSTGNDNNTISNNTIKDAASVPANLLYSNGTPSFPNTGNTVSGNTLKNYSGTGILITGTGTSNGNENWTLTNNTIYQESARSTTLTGISFSALGTNSISQNIIRDLNTSLGVTGILLIDARNTTISQNKIYNIPSTSGSTSTLTGIQFTGNSTNPAAVTIHNNMVSIAPSFSNNQIIRGIYDFGFGGNTFNAFYNSIYIGGTSSGTSASWALLRGTSAPTDYTVKNNIALNTRTGGGGNHFGGGDQSANTGAFVSDFNILVGTGVTAANFMDYGTSSSGTPVSVSAWQAGPPTRDANSQFSNPTGSYTLASIFQSAIDLHAVATSNPASAAGTPISVTIDFDNETRDATTPDLGADEFVATIGNDVGITALVSPVSSGCYTSTENVTVTLKNFSSAMIDFSVNNVLVTVTATGGYSSNVNLTSGTLAGNGTQDVTMPATIDLTANGTYTFNASTTLTGDINTANDAMTPTVRTVLSLGGTYPIGTGQSMSGGYETLTTAIADYNAATCFTGPVNFNLMDASYSTNETFPITILPNTNASSTNFLTIKPTLTTTITGSSSSAIFVINGADYVTINGSISNTANTICPLSTASRDLTIINTNTSTTSAVVWIQTNGTNGATNNKIINCNIEGNSSTTTLFGLGSGSSTIGTSSVGTDNDNNSFVNNNITKAQNGIYSKGASASNKNSGTIINQNLMMASSPNNIGRTGIWTGFEDNITISGNRIENLSHASDLFAISLGLSNSFSNTSTTGSDVTNASVTQNVIHSITNTGTNSSAGILLASVTSGTTLIANNMISEVSANGTVSDFCTGILLGGGTGSTTQVYYNSINMNGTIQGSTAGSTQSFCLAVTNTTAPVVDFRNNILVNNQLPNASGTTKFYSIGLAYSSTVGNYSNLTSDNNDLFVMTGTNYYVGITGGLAGTGTRKTLADWQAETGRDAASQNIDPLFSSSSDLHINIGHAGNQPLDGNAAVLSITNDIDCETRNVSDPDIGADEFIMVSCTGAVGGTASGSTTICGSGTPSITASGYSIGIGSTYQWQSSVDLAFTTPVDIPGQTNPASLNPGVVSSTTYFRLKVTCSTGNALDYSSIVTITVYPTPTASASSNSPLCSGATLNLMGSTDIGISYSWTGPNGYSSSSQNPTINNVQFTATGLYTFEVTSADGCTNSSAVSVTVNATPATPIVNSISICSGATGTLTVTNPAQNPNFAGTKIGTGTSTSSTPGPYRRFFGGHRFQMLYTAAEITASGLSAGLLTSLSFYVNSVSSNSQLGNVEIKLKNTSSTTLGTTFETGTVLVYSEATYQPVVGINTHLFNVASFNWDGTSNLLVEFCFNNNDDGATSTTTEYTTVSGSCTSFGEDNNPNVCSNTTGTTSSLRPNIRLTGTGGMATYTWNPGGLMGTSVMVSPATTTTYTVTADFSNGCPSSSTAEVVVNTLVVSNTNDSGGNSLRDVIDCAAPGSTITFEPALSGQTITLTSGEILINKNLTITGLGAMNLAISGNSASRIFHVTTGNTFNIEDMSLINGASMSNGGAFWNEGTMTIDNVIISGSTENGTPKGYTGGTGSITEFIGTSFIND